MNGALDTGKVHRLIQIVGEPHQHCSQTDEAVQYRNQFRHLSHLHLLGNIKTYAAADGHTDDNRAVTGHPRAQHRGQDGDEHAGHAVDVALSGSLLIAQAA